MARDINGNTVEFGRVVYVEPNNNINGTGRGTNFTFDPEDYSILVDLQVEVVDRFGYDNPDANTQIQYTMEWDAKGSRTSLFRGTNGFLSTNVLDTTFHDVKDNINQEAIGINSIEIRYNSWNYPEITIQFTDIRGASLMATSDYLHEPVGEGLEKEKYADNFANTFFSTFFRFPYPRYTLLVKGFYGRPVSYSLCVNDFKTRFNSQTGNFDVTVSFIGYMYGLFTDIPMRLLFAAPYCEYKGVEYWEKKKESGDFVFEEEGTGMVTLFTLYEAVKAINNNWEKVPEVAEAIEKNKSLENKKQLLQEIKNAYEAFIGKFKTESNKGKGLYEDKVKHRYLFLFSECNETMKCPTCNGSKKKIVSDGVITTIAGSRPTFKEVDCDTCNGTGVVGRDGGDAYNNSMGGEDERKNLINKIIEYNKNIPSGERIQEIPRIDRENINNELKGALTYVNGDVKIRRPKVNNATSLFRDVNPEDYDYVYDIIEKEGLEKAEQITKKGGVALCILRIDEFEASVNKVDSDIEMTIKNSASEVKDEQEKTYRNLLGFRVSLKNIIDLILAHLDTFMHCVYECMGEIKGLGPRRDFSKIGIDTNETDVESTVSTDMGNQSLYLPPFFGFRKFNREKEEFEDGWIGDDKRLDDKDLFIEIQLIEGLLNGITRAYTESENQAIDLIETNSIESYGADLGIGHDAPTFINDFGSGKNPYLNVEPELESIVAEFAYRCLLASVYSFDYPKISNRYDSETKNKKKYFEAFGKNDASFFVETPAFKSYREHYLSLKENGGNTQLELIGFDNFLNYLTGVGDDKINSNASNYIYFSGLKSPLFKKTKREDYVISCGDFDKKKVAVPINHQSPTDATNIVKNIIFHVSGGTEVNGFGVSRSVAMPGVQIFDNDNEFNSKFNEYAKKYSSICRDEKNLQDIGLYFKKDYIWKEYFAGKLSNDDKYWFPSIALEKDVNEPKSDEGKLFDGSNPGPEITYASLPMKSTTNLKKFFTGAEFLVGRIFGGDKRTIKNTSARDGYIEKDVIPKVCENPETITVYGLGCGDGTLFESELYALQNESVTNLNQINANFTNDRYTEDDIKSFRMAFLFLHSLPTSHYESLGKALETIIKRTYTPTITDIPISTMLFIGALYWRDRANGSVGSKTGPGTEDNVIVYGKNYQKAGSKQLITVRYSNSGEGELKPLAPKKIKDNGEYLTIITEEKTKLLDDAEKLGKWSDRLESLIKNEREFEMRYWGFWDVPDAVKNAFIDMFTSWAKDDFMKNIDARLSLRFADGTRYNPEQIAEYKNIVFDRKLFNSKGNANDNYTKNGLRVIKGESYNSFITRNFHTDLPKCHTRLGASKSDNSLMTVLRKDTEPVEKINKILTNGCVVKAVFPRVLMTRDIFSESWFDEVDLLKINKEVLKSGWEKFKGEILDAASVETKNDKEENKEAESSTPSNISSDVKLSLYLTIKNLHDKWLIATNKKKYEFTTKERKNRGNKRGEYRSIGDNFFYINSFYEYVGDEIMVNMEELPSQFEKVLGSVENSCSIYSFMYDVANQSRVQLLALPVFNDLSDPNYVREMFTPIPYDEIKFEEINTETQYVFMYPEESSKQLDMSGSNSRISSERYKYKDDSFILVEEGGIPATDQKMPKTFNDSNDSKKNVPVIGVTFAKQNQSFFNNISVSMDNPKTTEVAILNTIDIAEKTKNGNVQATALGQDLFPIYSNYSYECSVEMMGCACIMPLMYFQLNNIPMFKGTYIIYNVSHSITPGNMKTTFVGQRLSRYRKKRNEKSFASCPDDVLNQKMGITSANGENGGIRCYTCEGKLEHDKEYNDMARSTGVDKNLLRAVEYAEVRYNGGFFDDGNLRVYYDPWQAYKYALNGQQSEVTGITTDDQFDNGIGLITDYKKNISNIDELAKEVANNGQIHVLIPTIPMMSDMMTASACTIVGAFGIPAQAYSLCGAGSVSEFLKNCKNGFKSQGNYFASLLNSKEDLKDALKAQKWEEFANLYKGKHGIIESGVYMPGDSDGFPKYVEALKEGYKQAVEASTTKPSDDYYSSPGKDLHLTGPSFNPHAEASIRYAQEHPFDVRAAISVLNANVTKVLNGCNGINKTGKKKNGTGDYFEKKKWNGQKNVKLIDTPEHRANPGTKPAGWSLSLCATYVKCALVAGGYPYSSCNGGFCGPVLEEKGFEEIFRSGPNGETPESPGFDSKWQPGDVMTIEAFEKQEHGHIMMWNGKNWVSDFLQNSCKTYTNPSDTWKKPWQEGKYHVWRYRNRKNM